MSNYEKPVVVMAEESTEGVYLASGDHLEQCRFGRTEASAGADACQERWKESYSFAGRRICKER